MKPNLLQKTNGSLSRFGKIVSVAAVLLLGLVTCLTVDPAVHEFFHQDAGHDEHDCVVTAFAAGEALYLAPEIVVQPTTVVVERVHVFAGEVVRDSVAAVLPPVCGPPARGVIA